MVSEGTIAIRAEDFFTDRATSTYIYGWCRRGRKRTSTRTVMFRTTRLAHLQQHVPNPSSIVRLISTNVRRQISPFSQPEPNESVSEDEPKVPSGRKGFSEKTKSIHEAIRRATLQLCSKHTEVTKLQNEELWATPKDRKELNTKRVPDKGYICSYSLGADTLYVPGTPPKLGPGHLLRGRSSQLAMLNDKDAITFQGQGKPIFDHIWFAMESLHAMRRPFDFSKIDVVCSDKAILALFHFRQKPVTMHTFLLRTFQNTLFIDFNLPDFPRPVKGHFPQRTTQEIEELKDTQHYRWRQCVIENMRFAIMTKVDARKLESLEDGECEPSEACLPAYLEDTSVVKLGNQIAASQLVHIREYVGTRSPSDIIPEVYFSGVTTQMKYMLARGKWVPHRADLVDYKRKLSTWSGRKLVGDLTDLIHKLREITQKTVGKACIAIAEGTGDTRTLELYQPLFKPSSENVRAYIERKRPEVKLPPLSMFSQKDTSKVSKFWP